MANKFVRSGAAGAGTGADWANAYTTLAAAMAGSAAGDDIFVAADHAESTAGAVTITCPGTLASPCRILCVDSAGSVPPVSADLRTTATVSATGANNMTLAGHFYCYGITFQAGSAASAGSFRTGNTARDIEIFENCGFVLNNSSASSLMSLPLLSSSYMKAINCTLKFGSTSQAISVGGGAGGKLEFVGGSMAAGSSTPAYLLSDNATTVLDVLFDGFDFSGFGATMDIFRGSTGGCLGPKIFRNCKMPASWSGGAFDTAPSVAGSRVEMYNCDAGDTNYRLLIQDHTGTIVNENTIVRTGGANDGTAAFSWKMTATANADFITNVLRSPELFLRNDSVGASQTLTVELVHDSVGGGTAGALTDKEAWLEVQYLGTSGFPLSSLITDKAVTTLTAAADQAGSSETWTTTGLVTPVKQKLSVTFTPQEKGAYIARVCIAGASDVVYIDPKITVS